MRFTSLFSRKQWMQLSGLCMVILGLHVIGFGLFLYYVKSYRTLTGLGILAYSLGLRHAFDVDHIAAIDNTTRKLLQDDERPMGVGFFFSLGHSTVVLLLTLLLGLLTENIQSRIPILQSWGGYIGTSISGLFLWAIGLLNLMVLIHIVRVFRVMKIGRYDEEELEQKLQARGLMNRFFFGKLFSLISHSWQMLPIGFLFGLGFDTATEVALLAVAAGAATKHVPLLALLSLPLIFMAGMSLMDTIDGIFMSRAYHWAFSNPVRKIYYNLTVTSMSVAIALLIGTIELLQVVAKKLNTGSGFWGWFGQLNFGLIGYAIVGLFLVTWLVAAFVWKNRRIAENWAPKTYD